MTQRRHLRRRRCGRRHSRHHRCRRRRMSGFDVFSSRKRVFEGSIIILSKQFCLQTMATTFGSWSGILLCVVKPSSSDGLLPGRLRSCRFHPATLSKVPAAELTALLLRELRSPPPGPTTRVGPTTRGGFRVVSAGRPGALAFLSVWTV